MDVDRILEGQTTVAGKIRALAAAGYARADIARLLGKRYQHVRNVLEDTPGMAEPGRRFVGAPKVERPDFQDRGGGTYWFRIRSDGSILLPPAIREAWGVTPGSGVIGDFDGETLSIVSGMTTLREAQTLFAKLTSPGVSLADELIEDRRREAEAERNED